MSYFVKYSLFICSLLILSGCIGEEKSPVSPGNGELTNPVFDGLGLNIQNPSANAGVLDRGVISGRCSHANHPVTITSNVFERTIYSICQSDFTWAAAFDIGNAPVGAFEVQAQIFTPDYSSSSAAVSLSLSKEDSVCSESNASDVFANFKNGGDGSAIPYVICNVFQFSNIRFYPSAKFVLGRNIDFANKVFEPIVIPFKGELDGKGFQLSNIVVKDIKGGGVSVGLFKYMQDATVRNLSIKNAFVEGYQRVGVLAGDWRGSGLVENVKIQGKIAGVEYVGGLAGIGNGPSNLDLRSLVMEVEVNGNNYVGGVVSHIVTDGGSFSLGDSYILSKVSGNSYVGGVVGRSMEPNFSVSNTERIGNISAHGSHVGGIAGQLSGGVLSSVSNVGEISAPKDAEDVFVGGLVGEGKGAINANGSWSAANIATGGHYVGGLFGRVHSLTLGDSYSRGTIAVVDDKYDSVTRFVGGLAGSISLDSSIANSRSYANIQAKAQYVGGLVGVMNGENSSLTNSFYKGSVSAYTSHIGAVAGVFAGSSLERSFAQAAIDVTNPTPKSYIGGVAGQTLNSAGVYSRLYSKSSITVNNGIADYVGGVFGYMEGQSLSEAYFNGSVSGARSIVGGLVGYAKGNIGLSYVSADLSANFRYLGGVAGIVQGASITDVFVKGSLASKGETGGIAGWLSGSSDVVSRSYFVGSLGKLAESTYEDSVFGMIVGFGGEGKIGDSFYASSNTFTDSALNALIPNTQGAAFTESQLRNSSYYTNYVFGPGNWAVPSTGFKLPFEAQDHLFASFTWLQEANQGFSLPEVFGYDPLQLAYPSIFIQDGQVLNEVDQAHLAILNSGDPVQSISVGSMQISVASPAGNSETVSGKKLVYGECGIAGYPIFLGGDFNVSSICQANNRWAAVVDTAAFPVGAINFSVVMKSPDGLQSSNSISKTMYKSDDLCDKEEALKGTFANSYLGADGAATPFKICHAGHFANIAFYPDANFELARDVDFGGNLINPIQTTFTGSLDGKNHALKNYKINKPSASGAGLFRLVKDASISNLQISGAYARGYEKVGLLAGAWSGQGVLSNVSATGEVKGILYTGGLIGLCTTAVDMTMDALNTQILVSGNGYTGGVLGFVATTGGSFSANDIVMKNTVEGLNNVGGFIGSSMESNFVLSNVSQNGSVSALKENVGGVAGALRSGSLTNIAVEGSVTSAYYANEANAGGAVGLVELTGFALNTASFNGSVSAGGDNVGGIVGKLSQGNLSNLQSHGTLSVLDQKYSSVRSYAGGLVGHIVDSSTLNGSFSTMSLDLKAQFAGGLVGRFHGENSVLTNSFFEGSLAATTAFVGGVAGFFFGETFHDNHSTANISVSRPTPKAYIGGIVGYANSWTSDYQRIYATGNITITDGIADYVGGLIGYFRGGSLRDCYATGSVAGARSAVGGLVGLHRGATNFCFASGDVSASFRYAGGLVGYLLDGQINDSYSLGDVLGGGESGGIVGHGNSAAASVRNVYAYGSVRRAPSSQAPLSEFGPVIGLSAVAGVVDENSSLYASELHEPGQNAKGKAVGLSQASNVSSYDGFDFASPGTWRMPEAGFVLPGQTQEYSYPIHAWLGSGQSVQDYSVSGNVAGLNYGDIVLDLNGSEQIALSAGETSFAFSTKLFSGESFLVTASPASGYEAIECSVSGGVGMVGTSDITGVSISCPSLTNIALNPSTLSLAAGNSSALSVQGTLSNGISFGLVGGKSFSSSNTGVATVSGEGVVSALVAGQAQISASAAGLGAVADVSVFQPVAQATNIAWQQTSPHNQLNIASSWTPSASANVAGQIIFYYEGNACSGAAALQKELGAGVSSDSYTGQNQKSYVFKVRTISVDGVYAESACSTPLSIQLDPPAAATSVASAQAWISGALPVNSPLVTWVNPNVEIDHVEVGLGSSFGADDIAGFASVATSQSYTFQNLSGLTECAPYFPSVKVVDTRGLVSETATDTIGFRYDNTPPEQILAISHTGEATETSSPQASWSAPGENCALRFYEAAIGTAPGQSDASGGFKAIGNVTAYQAVSGLHGFNLSLTPGVDYYFSVRAVDYAGNRGSAVSGPGWQVPSLRNSLPGLALWLDSSDPSSIFDLSGASSQSPSFDGRVHEWSDVSESASLHIARAPAGEARPYLSDSNIFFNGGAHVLTLPTHADLNNAIMTEKSVTIAFRAEHASSLQTLYEEGDAERGMGIYIVNDQAHCAFWNLRNDGDGSQSFINVSAPVQSGQSAWVSWVFDYSNYTGRNGADGQLLCYVNGQLAGSAPTTSRIHPHTGAIGIGAKLGDTHYHTGASYGDGEFFRGEIFEIFANTAALSATEVGKVHTYLTGKWAQGSLSRPNALAIVNNAQTDRAALASWSAIDPNLFQTSSYEIAIGTTPGGTEEVYWTDIGNVLSYQAVSGVDGFGFLLEPNTDYYLAVRALDSMGNPSSAAISNPFKIFDFASDIQNIALSLQSSDTPSILDRNGNSPGQGGFRGEIDQWLDNSGNGHVFTTLSNNRPAYDSGMLEAVFDGKNHVLGLADSSLVNNAVFTEKSVSLVFATGADVNTRQVLYEEGDSNRGLNIYIDSGHIYCGFWNLIDDGDGAQSFTGVSAPIGSSQASVVTWTFNFSNGELSCHLNGALAGSTPVGSRIHPHPAAVLGAMDNQTRFHDSADLSGKGHNFSGSIMEVLINNKSLRSDTVQGLHNYLLP